MSQEHWRGHRLCSDGDARLLLAVSGLVFRGLPAGGYSLPGPRALLKWETLPGTSSLSLILCKAGTCKGHSLHATCPTCQPPAKDRAF